VNADAVAVHRDYGRRDADSYGLGRVAFTRVCASAASRGDGGCRECVIICMIRDASR
jgi:hypothetical protein